jgi:hypothetical protein
MFKQICALLKPKPTVIAQDESLVKTKPAVKRAAPKKTVAKKSAAPKK